MFENGSVLVEGRLGNAVVEEVVLVLLVLGDCFNRFGFVLIFHRFDGGLKRFGLHK